VLEIDENVSGLAPLMMHVVIGPMQPPGWEAVRAISLKGIATGNATFEIDASA
jgi:hypothetical protein